MHLLRLRRARPFAVACIAAVTLASLACGDSGAGAPPADVGASAAAPGASGGDGAGAGGDDAGSAADDASASRAVDAAPAEKAVFDGFFPIAADYQPHASFAQWKQRGVNTMIRVPPVDDVDAWTKEANALGLHMIREPRHDPHDDLAEANLLAWHWEDEPELHGIPASDLTDFANRMHAIDPSRPVFVNFWGGGILQSTNGCYAGHCYGDYIKHADLISDDIYPCNKYQCDVTVVGRVVSQLRRWSTNAQSTFAYIETSDFDGNGTGPSARRWRAEVWDAIIHGARGVFYFCVRLVSGCTPGTGCIQSYDATAADIAAEMPALHASLGALAPVLQTAIDPGGVSLDAPSPLEAGWRKASDGSRYYLVLNTSENDHAGTTLHLHDTTAAPIEVVGESRTVSVAANGTITDDFAPYATHVYRVR